MVLECTTRCYVLLGEVQEWIVSQAGVTFAGKMVGLKQLFPKHILVLLMRDKGVDFFQVLLLLERNKSAGHVFTIRCYVSLREAKVQDFFWFFSQAGVTFPWEKRRCRIFLFFSQAGFSFAGERWTLEDVQTFSVWRDAPQEMAPAATELCSRTFITFTDHNIFNDVFPQVRRKAPQRPICPVTRLPAKYIDPITETPYATLQAFRLIRDAYTKQLGQQGQANKSTTPPAAPQRKQKDKVQPSVTVSEG